MTASDVRAETLVDGSGAAVAPGGSVLAQVWLGDATAETPAWSTWDDGAAQLLTAGASGVPALDEALVGATAGSRVAVTADGAAAFGSEAGNPDLGIGPDDAVLVVLDVVSVLLEAPAGEPQPLPAGAPVVVEDDGAPVRLDTSAATPPVGRFQKAVLVQGTGPEVGRDATVAVHWLGQTWAGAEPFAVATRGAPTVVRLGDGSVIEGWDKMIAGSTVGSRLVFEVPPKLGYGSAGDPEQGITGTDTLFYVVDVLGVA